MGYGTFAYFLSAHLDSGEEIGTLLSPEQIEQLMPEVDLKSINFSAPTHSDQRILMLAEPQA